MDLLDLGDLVTQNLKKKKIKRKLDIEDINIMEENGPEYNNNSQEINKWDKIVEVPQTPSFDIPN